MLILKMHMDTQTIAIPNLNLFYKMELVLDLTCILSMLEALNYLIKFLLHISCFVGDMVATIKLYHANLFVWYMDIDNEYSTTIFCKFNDITTDTNEVFF